MYQVKFADIGEGLTEGIVAEVLVKVGDSVKEGQPLYFVETDKVNSEIPSPISGKIAIVNIKPGQEIKVGEVVIEIDNGNASAATVQPKKEEIKPIEENASVVGATPVSNEIITRNVAAKEITKTQIKATPLARKIAADLNVDLSILIGSGPNGRILVADVKNYQPTKLVQIEEKITTQSIAQTNSPMPKVVDVSAPLSW
ncbi:pyruvate dehydrogenase E2 component, partial [Metamycoplasma alkalescens]